MLSCDVGEEMLVEPISPSKIVVDFLISDRS